MNQVPPDMNPILWRERIAFERGTRFSRLIKIAYGLFGVLGVLTLCALTSTIMATGGEFSLDDWLWDFFSFYMAIFVSLSQVVIVIFFVPPLVAGAITEERKRETLDLLFVTPLKMTQILNGKLRAAVPRVARLVGWMGCLLVFALPSSEISLIGVLLSQLVVLITAIFVLTLTLYLSSRLSSTAVVLSVTYGAFFGLIIATFIVALMTEFMGLNFPIALSAAFLSDYDEDALVAVISYVILYGVCSVVLYEATRKRLERMANR